MALLRFRHAYIIVAVLRSTALRHVVDGSSGRHLRHHGESSSSLHPDVHTVRPHPSGSGRCVLTPGPLRLLTNNQAPHLWCVAPKETVKESPRGGLTGRSTSSPARGACLPSPGLGCHRPARKVSFGPCHLTASGSQSHMRNRCAVATAAVRLSSTCPNAASPGTAVQ